MTLRDQLSPEHGDTTDLRESDDKITVYLSDKRSWIEVEAHHDKVFKFLRNMIDIFVDVAEKCECDTWEKVCLLNDWLDSLKSVKDKRFEDFKWEWLMEDDDDDE